MVFYNCLEPAVILGDFAKGLAAAILAKAETDAQARVLREREQRAEECARNIQSSTASTIVEEYEDETIVVEVQTGDHNECTFLQYCKWHAAEAIKKRLYNTGKYSKEMHKEIVNAIHRWIATPTTDDLNERRSALLAHLAAEDALYIISFY